MVAAAQIMKRFGLHRLKAVNKSCFSNTGPHQIGDPLEGLIEVTGIHRFEGHPVRGETVESPSRQAFTVAILTTLAIITPDKKPFYPRHSDDPRGLICPQRGATHHSEAEEILFWGLRTWLRLI